MFTRRVLFTVSLLALGSAGALAQDQVLTGKDAFGGVESDAPGVVRHITANDLEAPNATSSGSTAPGNVAMPAGALPDVPEGFKAEMVVTGIANPRAIRFAPNGDLFVANSRANEVRVYRFAEGSATPAQEAVFASSGLDRPYGIAFYPPGDNAEWVYIANRNGAVRFPYTAGDLEASAGPETILENMPSEGHWTRDIVFSPDGGTMYYSVGSGSNTGEGMPGEPRGGLDAWVSSHALGAAWSFEEGRAAVLAFDPDGGNGRVFATGLRNCAGMALQPATGAPWCAVNERDGLGDNVPFDFATSIKEGAFYGWPWYYIGANEDPGLAGARPDLKGQVTVPDVLFQAHSAPLNIAFYDNDAWGPDYEGDAFVAMHGSWNRGTRTGYKVVRLDFDASGKPAGTYEDFVTGFVLDGRRVWGRPVGVAVSPDGSLFVSEDASGSIWKISKQ